ncbi:MAG: aminoglycoside phosphotransferase family protein [Ornithinimicrobium sp.]|uniref:aminoglycoside phosphotransferase family protein n=1 Tax=Ornithinimicrobium sp. TaxID=1977084 RepID=UPI0026DF4CBA|nr:aminoglycoside phosphotransferase family protein [Ornithinimicrobium sp.]MDO5740592.1 aminoglycoside phosphotransferase family protein [Ornithinimicrobium sp.]
MSLSDPGLALVLDRARLGELVGREVRATHLRPKLGVSTVAALTDPAGVPWGWVRTLTGRAAVKADKARRCAAEIGRPDQLCEAVLDGRDTLVQWGPIITDPRLVRACSAVDPAPGDLLRYNPLRRLVARDGDRVVRVTADRHRTRLVRLAADLSDAGVPVVRSSDADGPGHQSPRISWWPWIAGTDASTVVGRPEGDDALREVGRVLGALHTVDPSVVRDLPARGWDGMLASARACVELLEAVDQGAAGSVRRVLDQLASHAPAGGPSVVCHGDLSLDQLLVRAGSGEVLLTDLDRTTMAPVVLDHASLIAVDLLEGHGSLGPVSQGYVEVTGHRLHAPGPWVAAAILARVAEPWRHQQPGWRGETVRRAMLARRALVQDDLWGEQTLTLEVVG